jgi:hypothetical protein
MILVKLLVFPIFLIPVMMVVMWIAQSRGYNSARLADRIALVTGGYYLVVLALIFYAPLFGYLP